MDLSATPPTDADVRPEAVGWNRQLVDQLDWQWQWQLRPRLRGLTDDEYFWEPVDGCWNVRPRSAEDTAAPGSGPFTVDIVIPEPDPPPVTTIAWRLSHIIVGVLAARSAGHFGGPPARYESWPYAGTADEALDQLDAEYTRWVAGVRGLGEAGLSQPCGPSEGPYANEPISALILHISREVIHHGAEIALLRDLYLRRD